jgi:hypothetical protein
VNRLMAGLDRGEHRLPLALVAVPLGRSCDCKSWEQLLAIIQKQHPCGNCTWMSILQIQHYTSFGRFKAIEWR